ncbi:hypothetical protein [Candidatus Poriferisodalis sp.]|uniref:hypothetical protein n=1 Tax=Candidatus Poriferisodalis sp. TaxID=3101277 RepID=UPI003B018426
MTAFTVQVRVGRRRIWGVVDAGWQRTLRVRTRQLQLQVLARSVALLMRTLPKITGRLRRSTRMSVESGGRRYRIWSFAPYSRWVRTSIRVWIRVGRWTRIQLAAAKGRAYIRVRVYSTEPLIPPTRYEARVPYTLRLRKLRPTGRRVRGNEIVGNMRSLSTLKADVGRTVAAWLRRRG